ncbi:MAG: hypothetical protein KatS3mg014_0975 [Actinomycetota bacterium]|nr:MAG: hypothetical protein KatS3mg014_0975 [Actinomycetota bacterium]
MIHVIREEAAEARAALESAMAEARALAWNAFLPFRRPSPASWRCRPGTRTPPPIAWSMPSRSDASSATAAGRGSPRPELALLDDARGNVSAARDRFDDATRRSLRESDAWLWAHAFVLDHACAFAVRHGLVQAATWVSDLEVLAARTMMSDFLARAYLYRWQLGDAGVWAPPS